MRKIQFIIVFIAAFLLVVSVFAAQAGATMLTDHLGRNVKAPDSASRVAAVNINLEETILALGAWEQMISLPQSSLENPLVKTLGLHSKMHTSFSDSGNLNMESLLKANPDLVLTWVGNDQLIKQLEELRFPTIAVHLRNFKGLFSMIDILGRAFGREERGKQLADDIHKLLSIISKKTKGIRAAKVLWLGGTPNLVYGPKWVFNDIIRSAGAKDVTGDMSFKPWVAELSNEQIVKLDPDVIIIGGWAPYGKEDLLKDPRLAPLSAVRNGKIFKTPAGRANQSPYAVLMTLMVAHWCCPEQFPAKETVHLLDTYHRKFYGLTFSEVHPAFVKELLQ
jgi:iron complex transport system substrate-binding protein